MLGKAILGLTLLVVVLYARPAQAQLPGQDGFTLPTPISIDTLVALRQRIEDAHCGTPECQGYDIAATAYIVSYNRPGYAGTVYLGPPPTWQSLYREGGVEVNGVLNKSRNLWPEICQAVAVIAGHDDFSKADTTSIATWGLDIGRRITHPGLDCLGEVESRLPPSAHRDAAMMGAYEYCIVEPHAVCGRLKPPRKPPAH